MSPRELWLRFETYHDVTYFTPESRAVTDELGCRGGWMGYFGMRAAPLGAAAPETVTAAFFSFHPRKVARALPAAWEVASPEVFLRARLRGVDRALRRMLPAAGDGADGALAVDGEVVAEAAGLAVRAAAAAPLEGRVLGAANAALPVPEEPHLALWQACTTLRELRGDGHLAALVAAGLTACETLVLFGADKGLDPQYLRTARGWDEDEWRAAEASLAARGLHGDGGITPAGRALREDVERRTDEAAARPWQSLGEAGAARFLELMTPIALALGRRNDAMRPNPMALDPVGELTA
ncbi:SCO6745 family protein [Saccharothrix algeriensis]|uniref:SalK n=1 Tax=Saccharothrix algeriensis TaxID=173560 RepID=A0ABS2SB83_9PSEU|nr:hypothetical protein [Saccharothrix algeriensis]MBM7813225.1 hypothetical protein [Saccharothrix algeriensis]